MGRRLREAGLLQTIGRPPWEVGPVRARLQKIVLKVHVLDEQPAAPIALVRDSLQAREVPDIELGQVIFRQTIPSDLFTASGPGLLVEWRPNIAAVAAGDGVVV